MQEDRSLGPANVINNLIIKVRVDVPEELQEQIIRQHHNNPVHSYPRIA
jgi:hypothetical protein